VLSEEREKAKRVTYGIIYGLSPWGLAKGPGGLGIQVGQAQSLITSFLNHFSGVHHLPRWPWHLCHVCIAASFVLFMQQLCLPSYSTLGIMHTRLDSPAVSHTASDAAAASEH